MIELLVEKLIEMMKNIYSSEVDDEIVYIVDEYRYNDDDYESID